MRCSSIVSLRVKEQLDPHILKHFETQDGWLGKKASLEASSNSL